MAKTKTKSGPKPVVQRATTNFLTTSEVAELLRVTSQTVRDMIQSGKLVAIQVDTRYRIAFSSLPPLAQTAWATDHRPAAPAQALAPLFNTCTTCKANRGSKGGIQ